MDSKLICLIVAGLLAIPTFGMAAPGKQIFEGTPVPRDLSQMGSADSGQGTTNVQQFLGGITSFFPQNGTSGSLKGCGDVAPAAVEGCSAGRK